MIKSFLPIAILALAAIACSPSVDTDVWVMEPWVKADEVNPILLPAETSLFLCPVRDTLVRWEQKDVFNPAAVVRDGKVYLIYRAEDTVGIHAGTSRIGLAESADGLHFSRMGDPVLFPERDEWYRYEWEGGCEDPRVVQDEDGTYFMTYTAYDGKTARLLVASSPDLVRWEKHGSVFEHAVDSTWKHRWSKSGAIVTRITDGVQVAVKVGGKYWMYFGDTDIFAATSDNLVDWTPLVMDDSVKSFRPVLSPRAGKFDSNLVEPGPPAILTEDGIVLIYNGRNDSHGDPGLPEGMYCAGQALFDVSDPANAIDRREEPFMKPDKPYEMEGQVNQVCFLEGMVFFNGKWFVYYGTADSRIAAAVYSP